MESAGNMPGIEKLIERQVRHWDRIRATLGITEREEENMSVPRPPVVTLSREIGAGARIVARSLATRLDLSIVGVSLIEQVAHDRKLQKRVADSLDERTRSSIELIIESMIRGRYVGMDEYAQAEARTIRSIAARGGVIFLGRGANFVLEDQSDLNVRLIASFNTRVRRLAEYEHLSELDAATKVHQVDKERVQFIRRVFRADVNDPTHYDLVISTDRVLPEMVCDVLVGILRARGVPIAPPTA